MDCCYLERCRSPTTEQILSSQVSSPEMFDSDSESEDKDELVESNDTVHPAGPEAPSQAELIAKSDNYLLARINKFLTGVPPPPKHTICRSDCSEFLLRIYENRRYFWSDTVLAEKPVNDAGHESPKVEGNRQAPYQCTRSTSRNLSNAFDACDPQCQNIPHSSVLDKGEEVPTVKEDKFSSKNEKFDKISSGANSKDLCTDSFYSSQYCTLSEDQAIALTWPEAFLHKFHGIHYNRSRAVEEFESLTTKLCERYVGAETQSTCNTWFSKQAPGSARKRSLLVKRDNGLSPGKRLNHLTRRRRTFSSANLQGLGLSDKKQLVLNVKKTYIRKGKSPRGKSPRGKSPRGKSPRSSTKKKVARRLTLDGPSPMKSKLETSKRALFQSPTSDRAGPSRLLPNGPNPQNIKRALFPTPKKCEPEAERFKRAGTVEETRKRKNEDELEGPRLKWAKSLSFDCAGELHNNTVGAWDTERHSSSSIVDRGKALYSQGRTELSDTHRKKLLWAVAEALRSKGIGMKHPQFKQYASNLARTIKKFMPDLENRNIPRKPGSTSDRMLKLAKHHVLFIIDDRPTN